MTKPNQNHFLLKAQPFLFPTRNLSKAGAKIAPASKTKWVESVVKNIFAAVVVVAKPYFAVVVPPTKLVQAFQRRHCNGC